MDVDRILNLLKNKSFRKLIDGYSKPSDIEITTKVTRGFDLSHHIKGLSEDTIKEVIKTMEDENIIEKEDIGNTVQCPYCGNINLFEYYKCPICGSTKMKKIYMLQHKDCGKVFTSENLVVDKCPRCDKPISSIEELELIGGLFKCDDCGEKFEHPEIRYKCSDCGADFSVREAKVSRVFGYKINEKALGIIEMLFAYNKLFHELLEVDMILRCQVR
jgi:DNA-directed RNA polymerase subunit RPC12/RpoP